MSGLLRLIVFGVCLTVLSAIVFGAPTGLPEQTVPQPFGVNIHFTGPDYNQIEQIANSGVKFVRMDFTWADVEKSEGSYDFSAYDGLMEALESKGIRPLFILDYGNPLYDNGVAPYTKEGRRAFADFAGAAAAHFKGRGVIWEIWNEPNITFWKPKPSAEDYVALAKASSEAIKTADPEALVVGPATAGFDMGFIEKCFRFGLLQSIDAVSVHPYRNNYPETAISDYQRLKELIKVYAPEGKEIPVICGEWGYSTTEHSEETQAQYAARMMLVNLMSDVRLTIWYDWQDDGSDPKEREHHFGTVYRDFNPKPSYTAIQTLSNMLNGCKLVTRMGGQPDDYLLLFKGPEGYRIAAWTTGKEHDITLPLDVPKVIVAAMNGSKTQTDLPDGKLKLKLSQSPVYVEVGNSKRLALEEAVVIKTVVDDKWRLQDVITATINNPLSKAEVKGSITITIPGQKPEKKRFSAFPGKSHTLTFKPNILWDGRSAVTAEAVIAYDDMEPMQPRIIDLGTSHRIYAKAGCPLGRILEFRIYSPMKYRVKGKLRLFDVKGLQPASLRTNFEVESLSVVGLTLNEPAPQEFSFGYELLDGTNKVIFKSPVLNYTVIDGFAVAPEGELPPDYCVVVDGDENVACKVTAECAKRDTPYPAIPPINTCKFWYDIDSGSRFFRLSPTVDLPLPAKPLELGFWLYGDRSGSIARCRFIDSNGQVFQPEGVAIEWQGWRYRTMPLDGTTCSWWGGPADGKIHGPLKWDSLFLLDTLGKETKGTIYLGPMMIVSEPEETTE